MTTNEAQDKAFSRFQCKDTNLQVFNKENTEEWEKEKEKRGKEIFYNPFRTQ